MAVTVGPIGTAPAPTTPGDRRIDLTTGTVWRADGTAWRGDAHLYDDVIAALLAEPTSQSHSAVGAWQNFTPTLNNFTGTVNWARYRVVGKSCRLQVAITLDAVPTGRLEVAAPLTAASSLPTGNMGPVGTCIGNDVGTARRLGAAFFLAGNVIAFGSTDVTTFWGVSTPHVWASGDTLAFNAEYELA